LHDGDVRDEGEIGGCKGKVVAARGCTALHIAVAPVFLSSIIEIIICHFFELFSMSNRHAEAGGGGAAFPIFNPGYGHDMHRQPARTLSAGAEMSSQVSLPTGQKVYELDVSIFQHGLGPAWKTFEVWSRKPHEFQSPVHKFCNYMAIAEPTKSDEQCAFHVTNYPSRPLISHQLLKLDGFMLGRLVTCEADEDVLEPSPFAVYEVNPFV
jgi:hypothetical protein